MKGLCSLFVGQAGIQIANAVWEMLCLEHDVRRDGIVGYEPSVFEQNELGTMFEQIIPHDKYIPRCVMADLEPTVIGKSCLRTVC